MKTFIKKRSAGFIPSLENHIAKSGRRPMRFFSAGFTLIELLMVIAIIGILASIIINQLTTSRGRANDAKVKQELSQFRTAAEVYYGNQTPSFGYSTATDCITANTIFTDTNTTNGRPGALITVPPLPSGTTVICGSNSTAFAVKATLYGGNSYWCVDNRGTSKSYSGAIGSSITQCPP